MLITARTEVSCILFLVSQHTCSVVPVRPMKDQDSLLKSVEIIFEPMPKNHFLHFSESFLTALPLHVAITIKSSGKPLSINSLKILGLLIVSKTYAITNSPDYVLITTT